MQNIGFMRRKAELWQWMSPNWGGFTARVGWSNAHVAVAGGEVLNGDGKELDPSMLSIGLAYTHAMESGDELWLGFGYQEHEEWAALDFNCDDSSDDTMRLAGRYIHDWQNGHSTRISVAYEEMSWDWDSCSRTRMGLQTHKEILQLGFQTGKELFTINAAGDSVDVEREVYLVSGKHDFPGPLDFRFMYMEADDYDCGADCGVYEDDSGAE